MYSMKVKSAVIGKPWENLETRGIKQLFFLIDFKNDLLIYPANI